MFKPLSDFMVIDKVKVSETIIAPTIAKTDEGDTFKIIMIGPGYRNDDGKLIPLNVEVNDVVMIVGNMIKYPYVDDRFIARAGDVVCVDKGGDGN